MADVTEEQEPSIEDILESIRQIISDDEEEEDADGGDLKAKEEPEDKAADVDIPEEEDDDEPADIEGDVIEEAPEEEVLELNDIVEDADGGDLKGAAEDDDSAGDIEGDMTEEVDVAADIVMEELDDDDGRIMSDDTEDAATDSFSKLAANVFVEEAGHSEMVMPPGRITLEQMTRELMRPMLKEWLDRRLPGLVEELVQKEIKKLSDRAK